MPIFASDETVFAGSGPIYYQYITFADDRAALLYNYGGATSPSVQFYTTGGAFNGLPIVGPGLETVMGPDNNSLLSVYDNSGNATFVRFTSTATKTEVPNVLTSVSDASIAVDANGNALVIGRSGNTIVGVTVSSALVVGTPFTIFDTANPKGSAATFVADIDVTALSNGGFAVAFWSGNSFTSIIVNGTTPGTPADHPSSGTSVFEGIASLAGGRHALVENNDVGLAETDTLRIYENTAIVANVELAKFTSSGGAGGYQTLQLADGHIVVVWSQQDDGGSDTDIKAQILSSTYEKLGTAFTMNTTTAGNQGAPHIWDFRDGEFGVSWQHAGGIATRNFDVREFNGTGAGEKWVGGTMSDTMDGAGGDDTLQGGKGDDAMKGGEGAGDVVLLSGNRADYTITLAAGIFTIVDGVANRDGTDVATEVELFNFNGTVITSGHLLDAPATTPVAFDDTNAGDPVIEKGNVAGDATASGNVLTNDTTPTDKMVLGVRAGPEIPAANFTAVSDSTAGVVLGTYGSLTLHLNGTYTYTLNDTDPDTQALKTGQTATDVFSYKLSDPAFHFDTGQLTITIAGSNESGSIVTGNKKPNKIDLKKGVDGHHATNNDDQLFGKDGKDIIKGGGGDDLIVGGKGIDKLIGNDGMDQFMFAETGKHNADVISDFAIGADKILLDGDAFSKIGDTLDAGEFVVSNKKGVFKLKQKDDHILYNKKTGDVLYDDDGKGKHAAVLIATLDSKPHDPLHHTDFMIV